MSRLLVLGDVHGAHRAMVQVFERSSFDYENDRLIFLGDVADGWHETRQCVDEFLKIKNLTFILGNHDRWFREWINFGLKEWIWTSQGGMATIESYGSDRDIPTEHADLLNEAVYWHEDENRIFVHAGFSYDPRSEPEDILTWDRLLWGTARSRQKAWEAYGNGKPEPRMTEFGAVYLGHTATEHYSLEPVKACEIWNLDQGAGWSGKLTLMDVDSGEYWQSDLVPELYPEHNGRMG